MVLWVFDPLYSSQAACSGLDDLVCAFLICVISSLLWLEHKTSVELSSANNITSDKFRSR